MELDFANRIVRFLSTLSQLHVTVYEKKLLQVPQLFGSEAIYLTVF
jgi:hypothetical protein